MSCDVSCRCGSDLIWLWRRPVVAAPTQPLAWEPPYVIGVALKRQRKKERGKKEGKKEGRGGGREGERKRERKNKQKKKKKKKKNPKKKKKKFQLKN